MSTTEFWEDAPDLFWAYRFSYVNKLKEQRNLNNFNAWLQGAYFYEAISVSLSNAFGNKKTPYRDKPFDFNIDSSTKNKNEKSVLDEQIKARAEKIKKLLGGATENE